ncbi:N-acetylmuramoyl-L-alanine amidase [Marispirochaeta sp.]|uniref:N-acetylmuramoyl-L-alanine amidase family protein n=1 Tax=Marispirochaeta sp. TaxID=2038653 RepID=UPI0029C70E06|nr:N-acetylmuramoyl-L-alanine amidase [Marispirochaeta sp.]
MVRPVKVLILTFLGLLLISDASFAETNITSLIQRVGGELLWDPVLERGIVNRGRRSVTFQVGIPFFLKDFSEVTDIEAPRRREDGSVVVSDEAAKSFISLFALDQPQDSFLISTIIIDPGHGGKDPGTIGTHSIDGKRLSLEEKHLVLQISQMVVDQLKETFPDKNIIMTRRDDRYLALEERTALANAVELGEQEAMIFMSIHANASLNRKASGFEVWYLPPEYRREILNPEELDQEQKTIAPILNSILEEEFTVESILLAKEILDGMESSIGTVSGNRGLKEESWFVVRNAKMPSVLVEIGFVTNPEEAQLLNEQTHLKKISSGIYNGLVAYIRNFEKSD